MKKQQPIRILHCLASIGRGGAETFLMNVYRNIDRSIIQFDFLYSFDGVYKDEIEALGGHLYQIPFITQCGPFAYRKHVMNFLKEHPEYTIVHSHMDKFSGLIVECCRKQGVPVRIAHSHSLKNEGGLLFQIVKDYYGKKILPNCTHKFACSDQAAQWMFPQAFADAIIVKNGIDISKYGPTDQRDSSHFVIGNVGRFVEVKNHSFLIDIFAEAHHMNPDCRLVLAGSGVLLDTIKEKVAALHLSEYVTFLGDCNDIPQLLSTTDVLCVPSLFEGLSIVTIEGQASGTPCVVSDQVALEANVTGDVVYLPLTLSAKDWAKKILSFQGAPKKDYRSFIVEKGYDISTTVAQLTEFYLSRIS